ncbi:Cell cycle protein [Candidatus Omnitrophus magneticus]|uniref:Cell cycle protein n=1 Tax=Candidatus Omnitrophus magneticus TaxID=1609969 RepID=A0A0F0CRV5_9BACT|nr:Cell cycle protein [Candidatus Omnitrophus magneticus]
MRLYKNVDKILLVAAILIALLGVVFVFSATYERAVTPTPNLEKLFVKQCIWAVLGICILLLISRIDYSRVLDFSYLFYVINLMFLFFVLVKATERYGAKRWIGFGFFSLQPSEFIKISVILVLATFLGARKEHRGSFGNYIGSFFIVAPAFLLIFL